MNNTTQDTVKVPQPQFRLHDHLGNTVVYFHDKNNDGCITTEADTNDPDSLEIIQRFWYYPFGMAMQGLRDWATEPGQWYRYNGKERDTVSGWYEYGARWYIDEIGRFAGVDPIADRFPHVSVFNYAENEPVGHIDLWGLQKVSANLIGQLFLKNGNVFTAAGTATVDIGNRGSVSASFLVKGLGAISLSHSQESGVKTSSSPTFDFKKLIFEVDRPRGIIIPDWVVAKGIKNVRENLFTPRTFQEAESLDKTDADFAKSMRFLLKGLEQVFDFDAITDLYDVTGLYDYDGTKDKAINNKGETYERKFTHVFRGKINDFEIGDESVKFKGKVVLSYTQQKCLNNCKE